MKTLKNTLITVGTTVNLPVDKVWQYWTLPEHITKWCQASDDWHVPYAENDLRLDGKFKTTMAARDGSSSFDFEGVYTDISLYEIIEYIINDGRIVNISFITDGQKTRIVETFESEDLNAHDVQRAGWQAILDSFKKYAESAVRLEISRIKMIYPCLWFNDQAKAAIGFYSNVFGHSMIHDETPIVTTFELHGEKFMALNGGPMFTPNPSISFYVVMETLEELTGAWRKLSDSGVVLMQLDKYPWSEKYGWVQDRFGINWQLAVGKIEDVGQKFAPVLMFTGKNAGNAEEAVRYYTGIFNNSSVDGIARYSTQDPVQKGDVKFAQFKLENYIMMAMDSSSEQNYDFNEALSLVVECGTQEKIDYYWDKLTADGGEESMCGWLKDKYRVSWQIIPTILPKLMADPESADRVAQAFFAMKKLNINELISSLKV